MADDSVAKDFGTLLAANGFGTVGTDLFEGLMPVVSPCVAIFETRGMKPVRVAAKKVAIERPGLMVQVKNADYETGYGKAQTIRRFLQGYVGTAGTGTYLDVTATGPVIPMGQNESGQFMFSVNFLADRVSQ